MTSRHVLRRLPIAILALLMAFGSVAGMAAQTPSAEPMTNVEVVDQVGPAVVTVLNLTTPPALMGQTNAEVEPVEQGAGTGFIISEEGYIVTNWHVVEGGESFEVILADNTRIPAELIGTDPRDDLAVVQIDPAAVPAVVGFANSDSVQVGEEVLAIGSPLGLFSNTVTAGIVSGVGRNQLAPQTATAVCQNYSDLIQHDAAINPGNSGGPLFNMRGEVIGVNTLGIPTTGTGQPLQGLFFAVPSNTVQAAVQELIETGEITATVPYLGVTYVEIFPSRAAYYGLPVEWGTLIMEVESGTAAAEAGLIPEDIIVAVNGTEISAEQSFGMLMRPIEAGEQVTFTVLRGGQTLELQATLGEREVDFETECALDTGQ